MLKAGGFRHPLHTGFSRLWVASPQLSFCCFWSLDFTSKLNRGRVGETNMRWLEQRARARLGEVVQGLELDTVESTDVLASLFTARGSDRTRTVCILHACWAKLPGFRTGFARAAWLTQAIDHGSVPRVLESGLTDDGMPLVVLEHVGGETLDRYLERRAGTVPPSEALRIVAALADGLAAIAEQGAVHGAVCPASIALTEQGAPRLLQAGWTLLREQAALHLGCSVIPGLAGYLSPNQATGERPECRDDVWSLGAVLFELLSGLPLRPGETDIDRLTLARDMPAPSLAARVPGAPDEIVALVDRILAPDARERLDSASEVATKCRQLLQLPKIAKLRRLSPREAAPESPRRSPQRSAVSAPSHSGVAPLSLPPDSATGTLAYRPSRALLAHPDAGTYSSRGAEQRIDTIYPKKH